MNQNESNNSASNSQKKYIKLNLNSILKGGAEDLPSPYIEETAIVDHPYKEQAYDLGANNENCKQTGGAIALPVDPFADHNPMNLCCPGFLNYTNVPQVDKPTLLMDLMEELLNLVSPMSYRFDILFHQMISKTLKFLYSHLIICYQVLSPGPFISSIGYSIDSLRSHQLLPQKCCYFRKTSTRRKAPIDLKEFTLTNKLIDYLNNYQSC